jgi:hypothetical protein
MRWMHKNDQAYQIRPDEIWHFGTAAAGFSGGCQV